MFNVHYDDILLGIHSYLILRYQIEKFSSQKIVSVKTSLLIFFSHNNLSLLDAVNSLVWKHDVKEFEWTHSNQNQLQTTNTAL